MIEVQVPKDISGYEATLIGPLTQRQAICVAAAIAVEYVYYLAVKELCVGMDTDSLSFVAIVGIALIVPILYMAMGKPYGMKPETYIYYFLLPALMGTKNRPYETVPIYDVLLHQIEMQELALQQAEAEKNGKKVKQPANKQPDKNKAKKQPKAKGKQDIMYL